MKIENLRINCKMLIPGVAEEIEKIGKDYGVMEVVEVGEGLRYSRSDMYSASALTAIGGFGMLKSKNRYLRRLYGCVTVLGGACVCLTAKRLNEYCMCLIALKEAPKQNV